MKAPVAENRADLKNLPRVVTTASYGGNSANLVTRKESLTQINSYKLKYYYWVFVLL